MANCENMVWLTGFSLKEGDGRAATMCTATCKSNSGSCRKPREKTSEGDRVNFCSLIYKHIRVFFGHNLKQADRQGGLALSLRAEPGRENGLVFSLLFRRSREKREEIGKDDGCNLSLHHKYLLSPIISAVFLGSSLTYFLKNPKQSSNASLGREEPQSQQLLS